MPAPKKLPSGSWFIQLRLHGHSYPVTEETEEQCRAVAVAIKAGIIEAEKQRVKKITVGDALDAYIESKEGVLSPSTILNYKGVRRNRFKSLMDRDISQPISWQRAVSSEAAKVSAKTLSNAWGVICPAMEAQGIEMPKVKLAQVTKKEMPWLDADQVLRFVDAARDTPAELALLLALHSLRRSEVLGLRRSDIDAAAQTINVSGAMVHTGSGGFVRKDTNKNATSQRTVPILIPRVLEILPDADPLVTVSPQRLHLYADKICQAAGLPEVGMHGLRRSFASLAYHLGWPERVTMEVGGWADFQTMHKIYIKLSDGDKREAAGVMQRFFSTGIANENANDLKKA